MRYSLSENAAFGDDGVLVPAAGTGSIHDVVWICYSPYVATNYPLQSFSTRIYNGLWKLPNDLSATPLLSYGSRSQIRTAVSLFNQSSSALLQLAIRHCDVVGSVHHAQSL